MARKVTATRVRSAHEDTEAIASLKTLRNLGEYSARLLIEVGIRSPEALRDVGAAGAFRLIVFARAGRVTKSLLWALDGALTDTVWDKLDPARKEELLRAVEHPSSMNQ
jgi:DNA transformation protein and related proteins